MKEIRDSFAYFWISGDFSTSEITEKLSISPTETREKGSAIPTRPGVAWKESCWQLHSSLPRDEVFIDSHLSNLLDILETKKEVIEKIQGEFETGINCVGMYTNSNPGFCMNRELIQRLARLNLSIDFDLYCYCDHDDDEDMV